MAHETLRTIGSVIGKSMSKVLAFVSDSAQRICSIKRRHHNSGMTHGDDFVLTGPTERLTELNNKMRGVFHQSKNPQPRFIGKHQSTEQKIALGKARYCVSA